MQRIPYPADGLALGADGQRVINVQRILCHLSPPIYEGFSALALGVMGGKAKLHAGLREIAILRVGHLSNCAYEVFHHEAFGKFAGLSEVKIKATKDKPTAELWSPVERAVIAFTDDIVKNVRPSDAILSELRKHISDTEVLDLIVSIGNYMMICRILETTGIELDNAPVGAAVAS